MKNLRKLFAAVLCLSIVFGTMSVASAFERPSNGPIAVAEDGFVIESGDPNGGIAPMAYPEPIYAAVRSITVYPLVRCVETGKTLYWTDINDVQYWGIKNSSSVSAKLTLAQTTQLNNLALARANAQGDGLTYELFGWRVVSDVEFNAQGRDMLNAKWHHTANAIEGTSEYKERIPYNRHLTIVGHYEVDPTLTTYNYSGWTGGFFYIGPSNGVQSLYIGSGIVVNSDHRA